MTRRQTLLHPNNTRFKCSRELCPTSTQFCPLNIFMFMEVSNLLRPKSLVGVSSEELLGCQDAGVRVSGCGAAGDAPSEGAATV